MADSGGRSGETNRPRYEEPERSADGVRRSRGQTKVRDEEVRGRRAEVGLRMGLVWRTLACNKLGAFLPCALRIPL